MGLLTEGGYPYAAGAGAAWCDQLVRGLGRHDFDVYALSRSARQESGARHPLPGHVRQVRTAPLWGDPDRLGPRAHGTYGRHERRRFGEHFAQLAAAVCAMGTGAAGEAGGAGPDAAGQGQAYRFAGALYALAGLARDAGGLGHVLRSEHALRILESACRAPGAHPALYGTRVADLLAVTRLLERALRPLSLDWYGPGGRGLAAADLCHAASAGPAALPGLLAKRFFGTPLLVTEYEMRLRAYYLNSAAGSAGLSLPVRTLLASFHRQLTAEVYGRADLVTAGDAHIRRWQERCGADRARLRTVHPGLDTRPYDAVAGARPPDGHGRTVVWAGDRADGPVLWQALAALRQADPRVRLRVLGPPPPGETRPVDGVLFETAAGPAAYAAGAVVVLAGAADRFPLPLAEAMLCGRATVAPDTEAVREVLGGTGLLAAPGDPHALADACLALLDDPGLRARLGAAARARALELFTEERYVTDFRGIYLELAPLAPVRHGGQDPCVPFAYAATAHPPPAPAPRATAPTRAGRP
ncbi:DUF3492 domain-containing protein [Streptomyces gamaensis]|uniref:D-inositol 3-phosphate glycosyltransferase n=1 Tax=Streptomyces gamaensis TaxID=1763542 RepID=A0ABW0YQH0_9ACTN